MTTVEKLTKIRNHIKSLHFREIDMFKYEEENGNFELNHNFDPNRQFSLLNWDFDCGMPACIGGHCRPVFDVDVRSFDELAYCLGITSDEAGYIGSTVRYSEDNPNIEKVCERIDELIEKYSTEQETK